MSSLPRFDVFLSYRSADRLAVENLAQRLQGEGFTPFLDRWHLIPGAPWQEGLEQALNDSATCAVFLGSGGPGPWENEEMRAALDLRAKNPEFRVIPVLLPGTEPPVDGLPLFLSRIRWGDFRRGLDDERAFHELVSGIRGVSPGPDDEIADAAAEVCPYRGLEAFREEDAQFFCGREGLTRRLVEALRASRFLAVLGPSGSGKSSLVRAGLIPALRADALPGSRTWRYQYLSPGTRPLEELAAALAGSGAEALATFLDLQKQMSQDARALHSAVRLALQGEDASSRILLVVDQLEELFTLCRSEEDRQSFLDNLLQASTVEGGRTVVVLTMRADFYGKATSYRELADRLASHQVVVSTMSEDELRQAIEIPARRTSLIFDEGLVEAILADVEEQPGGLPLLEHALLELWRRRRGRRLTQAAYAQIQGVKGAIASRAEEIYGALPEPQQILVRRILLRLVQPGEGTEDTRRRALRGELIGDPVNSEEIEEVVARLVGSRLLTTSRDLSTGEEVLDVAHEALVRGWPRLRAWIEESRASLRLQRRLGDRADEWARLGRDEGSLLRGTLLDQLDEWTRDHGADMSPREREFLAESLALRNREAREKEVQRRREIEAAQAREREQRKRARLAIGAGVFAFLLAVFSFLAYRRAEDQSRVALARQLAAQAESALEQWPQRSLLLAIEAIETTRRVDGSRLPVAEEALRNALEGTEDASPLAMASSRDFIQAVAFSPDGRWLAAGGGRSVQLWSPMRPREKPLLLTSDMYVDGLAFSRDGLRLAAWHSNGSARVWRMDPAKPFPIARRNGKREDPSGSVEIAVSSDARRLAFGNSSGVVEIWDTTVSGGHVQRLTGPSTRVVALAFSSDGSHLAISNEDRSVRLWRLEPQGAILSWVYTHRDPVGRLAFTPDGQWLAIEITSEIRLRKITGDLPDVVFPLEHQPFRAFLFSPDASRLAGGSFDGSLYVWSTGKNKTDGDRRPTLSRPSTFGTIHSLAFSPDSSRLAVGSWENAVQIWNLEAIERGYFSLRGHEEAIRDVAFSPDGLQLASSSWDYSVRLWDLSRPTSEPVVMPGHEGSIEVLAFAPDGLKLMAGTWENTVRIWPVADLPGKPQVREHRGPVRGIAFSPGGRQFVTAGFDGQARFWNMDGSPRRTLEVAGDGPQGKLINAVAYSPDGTCLATAGGDHTIRLWWVDRLGTMPGAVLRGHRAVVYKLSFSPDGQWLASAADDGTVRLWNAELWRAEPRVIHQQYSSTPEFAFSRDGRYVATAGHNEVKLWKPENLSSGPRVLFEVNHTPAPLAFSPDGSWLALAHFRDVFLWSMSRIGLPLAKPRILRGHDEQIVTLKFSPDSRWLATGSADFTSRLWDLEDLSTGPVTLRPGKGSVRVLDFSPDGRWLATANGHEAPRLWRLRLDELMDMACARTGRNLKASEWDKLIQGRPYRQTCSRWPGPAPE